MLFTRCLRTAKAMATPSNVEVPLPNSSKITSECFVANLAILAVSSISMKKVLLFYKRLSLAPIRVKILSTIESLQLLAGTKHPIYAIIAARQDILRTVDLPPMFEPVNSMILALLACSSFTEG